MKILKYPFDESAVRALAVGDRVAVYGRVYIARDRVHKFLSEGGELPVELADGAIYHCGPVVSKSADGYSVQSAGPTTSIREEPYMAGIIAEHNLRVIIGKGGMGGATAAACSEHGCIYIQLVGGAAALIAQSIDSVEDIYFEKEFGQAEALYVINVSGLEGVVTIDSKGGNLHSVVEKRSRRNLKKIVS